MSKKIAFIGAGSFGFTYKLVADILMKKALFDCELSFMDISRERLDNLKILLDYHLERIHYTKKPLYTLDMEEALAMTKTFDMSLYTVLEALTNSGK